MAEVLRRLVECPENEWRRYLLSEVVQAYWPLDKPQREQLERLFVSQAERETLPMPSTLGDFLEARAQRRLLHSLLEERFGPLGDQARKRLKEWPDEQLETLGRALVKAQSLKELGLED